MSVNDQYLGFLSSTSLRKVESILQLLIFNFEELSKNSVSIDISDIDIPDNEVLGKRVERFFENCIIDSKQYHLICKNKQIFKDKITIGELDFIIQDLIHKKTIHVELVYKFYLYDPKIKTEIDRWVGPNRKDSLPLKIEKLKKHQFPLLYREETLPILEELKLNPNEIIQEVCYLGNLFIPKFHKEEIEISSIKNCIKGYWILQNEFTLEEYGNSLFFIPNKQDWIVDPKLNKVWLSYQEILPIVRESLIQKKSPLLWVKRNEDSYECLFIVWW